MQEKIMSADISVVVQGPIHQTRTKKTLQSIRKHLPDAEIILSTWENSNLEGLDFDILILNKDPGSVQQKHLKNISSNINRMILSTNEGMKKASRKYTLKLRTDIYINNLGFLDYFDKFPARCEQYKLFEKRIIASTFYTKYSIRKHKQKIDIPFHVSDWWFFGLTTDLKKFILSASLVEEPYFSNYFEYPGNKDKKTIFKNYSWQFAPEQYLGYSCFAKNFDDIKITDCSEISDKINKQSQIALANNFIFLEYKQSGIHNLKYLSSKNELFTGEQYLDLYTFYRFEVEYQKYCDKNYVPTAFTYIFEDEKSGYKILKFYKQIMKLIDNESPLPTKLKQVFFGIPFATIGAVPALLKNIKNKKH